MNSSPLVVKRPLDVLRGAEVAFDPLAEVDERGERLVVEARLGAARLVDVDRAPVPLSAGTYSTALSLMVCLTTSPVTLETR